MTNKRKISWGIFIVTIIIVAFGIYQNIGKSGSVPTPESSSNPIIDPLVIQQNQKKFLELINPLLSRYDFLIKASEISLPYLENGHQRNMNTIASLQNLQIKFFRNDVDSVIKLLMVEEEALLASVDYVKSVQEYAKKMKGVWGEYYNTFGTRPIDANSRKAVNMAMGEIDILLFLFIPDDPNSIFATTSERESKIDEQVRLMFQRLNN